MKAALAGHAILDEREGLSSPHRSTYGLMRLVHQKAARVRERLVRPIKRPEDLFVGKAQQCDGTERDVLPDDIGQDSNGRGHRWSVGDVVSAGQRVAMANGKSDSTPQDWIAYGLLEAARSNPFDVESISKEEARNLLRIALFDLGPATVEIDATTRDRVVERFLRAVEDHLDDDSEAFDRRFFDGHADIVHRISKQVKHGGRIPRDEVRQVLLGTIFDAFVYVGDGLHLVMADLARGLPRPLDPREQALFKAFFWKRDELGGLPLAMLFEQFDVIKPAIVEILNEPEDRSNWGILLRVLWTQAEIVRKKREVERTYKERRTLKRAPGNVESVAARHGAGNRSLDPGADLENLAHELREAREASCRCRTTDA
ncbi:MAG: hypothetical protein WD069_12610 [Planctomycetales bacterium]